MVDPKTERRMETAFKNSDLVNVGECPACHALVMGDDKADHDQWHASITPNFVPLKWKNWHVFREEY